MSELELAAELLGAFVAGAAVAGASIFFYARHVFRSKFGQLAGQLTGAATTTSGGEQPFPGAWPPGDQGEGYR